MSAKAAIAANRFGLGAGRGEIVEAASDPQGWLSRQLVPESAARFPSDGLSSAAEGLARFQSYLTYRRNMRRGQNVELDPEKAEEYLRDVRQTLRLEITARATFASGTSASFHERLTRFWSNHFSVSARSPQTTLAVGAFEREAIRPNILGSFTDLSMAAVFHPGMLVYLDNVQSVGPNSRGARRGRRGLNENLAREVMELHTVTPASGYTQEDVTEFARALTGHTIGNPRIGSDRLGEPIFAEIIHEPGTRTVLGRRYAEDGAEQALAILRDLCARPETARNVAFKLARHFVADAPPDALVARLERAFMDTGGDLKSVYGELIRAPEAWEEVSQKVKTPEEMLVSASRAIGLQRIYAGKPRDVYESLGQAPFSAPSPEGWPDIADAWLSPDALMKRIEWANRVSERAANLDAREFLDRTVGQLVSADTVQAVRRAESGSQALAIALMSPDFQRR